jgi:hypothetical protein
MKISKRKIIGVLIGLLLVGALAFWFKGWLAVDKCLDSGGRWNAENNECEH